MSSILFFHLIFLCLFNGHFSTNPDSVMVQSSEDNNERTGKMEMEDNEQKAFISLEGPRVLVIRYMRPITIGSRKVWREVYRERVDRLFGLGQGQGSSKDDDRINLWNPRSTTENSNINVNRRISFSDKEQSDQMIPNRVADTNNNNNHRINSWNSRTTTEKSNINVNRRISISDKEQSDQMIPNKATNNNNNNQENSKTVNPSAASNGCEEKSVQNPENGVTISPKKISPDSSFFAGIVNDFAFKLMDKLNLESNFVISPLSIFIALSMCYLGTDGHSKTQMEQALGMNDNSVHDENFHKGIKDLLELVNKEVSGYELFTANGMFLGENFTADLQFEEKIKNYYHAELQNLDFGNPEKSSDFIKEWISRKTKNMITSIFTSPLPVATRLILLNAIYFKGSWKTSFPHRLTFPAKFHSLDKNDKEVDFMRIYDGTFPVLRSDEYKHSFLKLPYEGDHMSMIIALPNNVKETPMPVITDQILCIVRETMVDTALGTVVIPKFRLEYKESLTKPLEELGITDIFNKRAVNLRKLRKENDIYVSDVLHKAIVEVNEVGSTAAAVSVESFVGLSYRNITKFVADHPFAFYIVHETTGLVLFYGKVFNFESNPNV